MRQAVACSVWEIFCNEMNWNTWNPRGYSVCATSAPSARRIADWLACLASIFWGPMKRNFSSLSVHFHTEAWKRIALSLASLLAWSFSRNSIPVERLVMFFFSGLEPASNDIGSVSDLKWRESPVASYRTGIHTVLLPQSLPAVLSPSRSMFPIPGLSQSHSLSQFWWTGALWAVWSDKGLPNPFQFISRNPPPFLRRKPEKARKLVSASAPMTSVWTFSSRWALPLRNDRGHDNSWRVRRGASFSQSPRALVSYGQYSALAASSIKKAGLRLVLRDYLHCKEAIVSCVISLI